MEKTEKVEIETHNAHGEDSSFLALVKKQTQVLLS